MNDSPPCSRTAPRRTVASEAVTPLSSSVTVNTLLPPQHRHVPTEPSALGAPITCRPHWSPSRENEWPNHPLRTLATPRSAARLKQNPVWDASDGNPTHCPAATASD